MRQGASAACLVLGLALASCGDDSERPPTSPATDPGPAEQPAVEPPAEPTEVVREAAFELRASSSGPYRVGEVGQFAVTLTPRGVWHVNQEFPTTVEVTPPAAIVVPKPALEREDAAELTEQRARFDVSFTPAAAGQHRVTAEVSFAVCTEENCIPDQRTLAVSLPVE